MRNNKFGVRVPINKNKLAKFMDLYGFGSILTLSRATGISRGGLSQILSGKQTRVTISTLETLAETFGCKADILRGTEPVQHLVVPASVHKLFKDFCKSHGVTMKASTTCMVRGRLKK